MTEIVTKTPAAEVAHLRAVNKLVNNANEKIQGSYEYRISDPYQSDGLMIAASERGNEVSIISTYARKPFPKWRDVVDNVSKFVVPTAIFGISAVLSFVWFMTLVWFHMDGQSVSWVSWAFATIFMFSSPVFAIIASSEDWDWWWIRWALEAPKNSRKIVRGAGNKLTKAIEESSDDYRRELVGFIKGNLDEFKTDGELSVWLEAVAKIVAIAPNYPTSLIPLTVANVIEVRDKLVSRADEARLLQVEATNHGEQVSEKMRKDFDNPLKDSALDYIDSIPLEMLK